MDATKADARRAHARAGLYAALREKRAYVRNGMPVGVSGQAALGVLINWTNRVADDLQTLDVDPSQLWTCSSPAVDEVSATRDEVLAEFERRLEVVERLIDERRV